VLMRGQPPGLSPVRLKPLRGSQCSAVVLMLIGSQLQLRRQLSAEAAQG
jgi:hypothetical protein